MAGRGAQIRTGDLALPKRALCQAELHPESGRLRDHCKWCPRQESNPQPTVPKTVALSVELLRRLEMIPQSALWVAVVRETRSPRVRSVSRLFAWMVDTYCLSIFAQNRWQSGLS